LFDEPVAAELLRSHDGGDFACAGSGAAVAVDRIAIIALLTGGFGSISADRRDAAAAGAEEGGVCAGDRRFARFVGFDGAVATNGDHEGEALAVATEVIGTGTRDGAFALLIPFEERVSALLLNRRHLPATARIAAVPILRVAVVTLLTDIEDAIAAEWLHDCLVLTDAGGGAETILGTGNTRVALLPTSEYSVTTPGKSGGSSRLRDLQDLTHAGNGTEPVSGTRNSRIALFRTFLNSIATDRFAGDSDGRRGGGNRRCT
jgi:hypothetical protein